MEEFTKDKIINEIVENICKYCRNYKGANKQSELCKICKISEVFTIIQNMKES